MSQAASMKTTSFWREALPAIKMVMRAKWPWVVGLILIGAATNFLAFAQSPSPEIIAQLKANPSLYKEHPELVPHGSIAFLLLTILNFCLITFAYYLFPVFYLQTAAKSSPPKPAVGGFFFWLWKSIQKTLLWILGVLLAEIGIGLAAGIVGAIFHVMNLPKWAIIPVVAIAVIGILGCSFHIYYRFYLVTPMAILGHAPAIKKSREITKGQCWRIFCGGFILFLMFGAVFFVPILGIMGMQLYQILGAVIASGPTALAAMDPMAINPKLVLLMGVLQSCMGGILAMTGAVYQCTVYRILLQERKANSIQSGA